ncbi:hypothetical protein ABR738_14420 [Streptomyces sp. Edi4]|uniref:hypothetical protein n=1 Tax=Streptomyces sp. Edi4 TaxID=3162527 RepID=UPI0033068D04
MTRTVSSYRALAEHEKRAVYPEAVEAAHTDFAALQSVGSVFGPDGGDHERMIYGQWRTKGAPALGALLPGEYGPFGQRPPPSEDDEVDVDTGEMEPPTAAVPAPRNGSGR